MKVAAPLDNIPQGRAIEGYRLYCGMRLQRQMSIPPWVLQRLGLQSANPQACQGFWPLVAAVGQRCEKKGYALLLEAIARKKREDMLQVLQRFAPPPPAD